MNIVLFQRDEIGKTLPLKDERAKHIIKVLHKQTGESFEAGIINGKAGQAKILSISDDGISFDFIPLTDGKPLYSITLIVGFPRPIQLKRLFRDAAGLGASRICLCGTELGEKSYMSSNIVERGTAYSSLVDGSAQAKSTHVPELSLFPSVKECISALFNTPQDVQNNSNSADIRVMLDNVKPETTLFNFMGKSLTQSTKMIYASIGSERGWTDNERSLFKNNGFASCSMGSRVLRTETAVTVALSLILQSMNVL